MKSYADFLARKAISHVATGIAEPPALSEKLKPFQAHVTRWALQKGRGACFLDCGLGKSWIGLDWSRVVVRHTNKPVLILTPLAVAQQFVREGHKLGVPVANAIVGTPAREWWCPDVWVANYESLHKLERLIPQLGGVVLDECFAAGTLIDTPSGRRPIESLRAGDEIHNASGVDIISDVHRREVEFCVRITAGSDSCVCSPNHPFFTQRGWVGAQDLRAGDHILETGAALRLVREAVCPSLPESETTTILRNILLSEMADAAAGSASACPHEGGFRQDRQEDIGVVPSWIAEGGSVPRADTCAQPDEQPRVASEELPAIERDRARTFRAWGQRAWFDAASADHAGCTWTELGGGVCLVVGPTEGGLSNALQARLGPAREENRSRGGWQLPPQSQASGREKGRDAGFVGVDSVEILEPGHSDLERLRAPDGKLYLYDLGGTRHPSFSVNGWLVHNSSILKAFDGKTRNQLIDTFRQTPFRLCLTATPSPNDPVELGNHAEFLGVMRHVDMLNRFFEHDAGSTGDWILKGHARRPFWRWVSGWSMCLNKPSDLGYSDEGYDLPPLELHEHVIDVDQQMARKAGMLFAFEASTLGEQREVRKLSIADRVAKVAELAAREPDEQWIIWGNLNAETEALTRAIPGAVEIAGSDSVDTKEQRIVDFLDGRTRYLVSKTSILGWGLNAQCAARQAFAGADWSFESWYQAVRRSWRFGQTKPVHSHMIRTSADGRIVEGMRRKQEEHQRMHRELADAIRREVA